MSRCEICGKRDRDYAHHCWDCGRTHWRDECPSTAFNDALRWCWCGQLATTPPPTYVLHAPIRVAGAVKDAGSS